MNEKKVTVERIFDANIQAVWRAITEKDLMKQWYFDVDDFRPEVGFKFRFPGQGHKGEEYMHICEVTEVIPSKRLQYSWTYENHEGYSLVTFELSEQDNGQTKLVLTHTGLESFPNNNPDFAKESFNEGWNYLVNISLKDFMAKNSN